ncbi:hypothetical protein TNCV_1109181 [Trichonephila clavipes]|nr:hypothetical protein TNCV_1109181 [Trichonephila clavipes]
MSRTLSFSEADLNRSTALPKISFSPCVAIVRVPYFVRGGFVGYRSRASSKHLSPHLPVGSLASSGGSNRVCAASEVARVGVESTKKPTPDVVVVFETCQVIYSQFGLAIHQNDHQARRTFVEWAQNEIAVVPDFHKRILFSDEAHFWLNGYVNKQNCRIWSEANPQVYVETPLHPEKLTVWCALWAGGILLQKR